jgi:branched-chain amino acid transport system substrate-binding protein
MTKHCLDNLGCLIPTISKRQEGIPVNALPGPRTRGSQGKDAFLGWSLTIQHRIGLLEEGGGSRFFGGYLQPVGKLLAKQKGVDTMKRKKRSWVIVTMGVLLFSLLVLGPGSSAQAATKVLKIGIILPFSGPISFLGVGLARAAELYFDKVNDDGGLQLGGDIYKIKVIAEDSKFDPTGASTAAKKVLFKDEARIIIGEIMPPVTAAIYQVCESAKALHVIPLIDAPGVPGDVSAKNKWAVRLNPTSDCNWAFNYDYIRKTYPQAKRLYMTFPPVGLPIEKAKKLAEERGFTVTGYEVWQHMTQDFLPYYTKALTTKPDVIQVANSGQAGFQIRTGRQLGFKGVFISDSPLSPVIISNIVGPEYSYDIVTNGMDLAHATPLMKEHMDRWAKKYKEPYFDDGPVMLGVVEALVQAIKKANSPEPEKILAAFDSMTTPGSIQTCWGPSHMGGAKKYGVNRVLVRPVPLTRITKSGIEFIDFKTPNVDD